MGDPLTSGYMYNKIREVYCANVVYASSKLMTFVMHSLQVVPHCISFLIRFLCTNSGNSKYSAASGAQIALV